MKIGSAYIEITNRCNLNCATCYNQSGMNSVTRELELSGIRSTLDVLPAYGCRSVSFSGGEPLLHSEIYALMELLKAYPELSFSFVTNGTLLTRELAEKAALIQNIHFCISLDGSTEEINGKIRGKGNYRKATEAVTLLAENGIPCFVKMVISRENQYDVEPFYRMAIERGAVPEFGFIMKKGNGARRWEETRLSGTEKARIIQKIEDLNRELNGSADIPACTYACPLTDPEKELHILIKSSGDIHPCQSLYHEKYALGNILTFSEEAVEDKLQRLRELISPRAEADFGCAKCFLRDRCGRGCPAAAEEQSGSIWGNDEDCALRKTLLLRRVFKEERT